MKKRILASLALLAVSTSNASANYYQSERSYEVTVTNMTKGQTFTPVLSATHKRAISFFELGQAASAPLAELAESGNPTPLKDVLDGAPSLVSASNATEGLLAPGESVTFDISSSRRFNRFSLAAMLIPTNDTFVSVNSVRLPAWGSRTYMASAYDAGSEANDELCANIPGPACGGAGASPSASDGDEGFVHIASGIHGEGDLLPSVYDWRDAVAKIEIRRVR
ncbi:spondin domain-containing protein [Glaciecola sp. MH2013]|uniref:spondin domain-containing protein n=1 Tax=Glaciecola sp. MH2013 TaxID=2785524 RepID=UPI0018A0E49B|nr:spondin domain-containing protein [Glaciecola sp. MH2013]MBF7074741.1 spondin domain-containing protein [Glaciecola sp. MH2013]